VPVALVLVAKPPQGLTVGQAQPALGTLQSLDGGFLVHTEHHGILRRVQVQRHYVSSLLGKLGVGTHAPTPASPQVDAVASQHPPDLMRRHIPQRLSHQAPRPGSMACRWRLVQLAQDAPLRCPIVLGDHAHPRRIVEPCQARLREALTPLHHPGPRQAHLPGYRGIGHPLCRQQDQVRPLHRSVRCGPAPSQDFQALALLRRQCDDSPCSAHARSLARSSQYV